MSGWLDVNTMSLKIPEEKDPNEVGLSSRIEEDRCLLQDIVKERYMYDHESGIVTYKTIPHGSDKIVGEAAGTLDKSNGYLKVRVNNKNYYLHRIIWLYYYGVFPKDKLDHIDGNRLNNKISNLREVNNSENMMNLKIAKTNNQTGYLEVSSTRKEVRWRATIYIDGKQVQIGVYNSPEEAHQAYLEIKREFHITCTI